MSFDSTSFEGHDVNQSNQQQGNQPYRGNGNQGGYQKGGQQGGGYNGGGGYNKGGSGGYQKPGGYGGGGGYNKGGGGYQKGGFQRNQEPEGPAELYMPYVGTGNQNCPPNIIDAIKRVAEMLEKEGYTMRCGGMEGCEDYFEKATTRHEIHVPWNGFNDKQSKFYFTSNHAKELAGRFQPGYDGLKPVIQTFLAKNVRMIMGKDLKSPAMFMVTWSEDGAETIQEKSIKTGNTGHAIAVASAIKIPVFNLAKPDAESRLKQFLKINHVQEQQPQPQQPVQQQPVQQPGQYQPAQQQPGQQYQPPHQPGNYNGY